MFLLLLSSALATDLAARFAQPDQGLVAKVAVVKNMNGTEPDKAVDLGSTFASGDQVRLEFTSNRDVKGIIYNQAPDGAVTRVYPPSGDGMAIAANTTTLFPPAGWLRFDGEPGEETLIVYLSEKGGEPEPEPEPEPETPSVEVPENPEYKVAKNLTSSVSMKDKKGRVTPVLQIALKAIVFDPPEELFRYVAGAEGDDGRTAIKLGLKHK